MNDPAIICVNDLLDKLIAMKRSTSTSRKGQSTGWPSLDELMLLTKGYLFIATGMPSSGKSEVMDGIAVNTAVMHDWSWAYYSPENYPIEEHAKKLVEKVVGKALWEMTIQELKDALQFVQSHFCWLYPPDDKLKPKDMLGYLAKVAESRKLDAYILDPWNELDHSAQGGMRDDQYISKQLTDIRRFNRELDLLGCVVIHPTKLQKDKDGAYPVPTLYDCNGGAMWRNKCDLGISVHRHNMDKHEATVYVQKVKYKWMGKPGVVDLDYEFQSGRFKDQDNPYFTLPGEELPY